MVVLAAIIWAGFCTAEFGHWKAISMLPAILTFLIGVIAGLVVDRKFVKLDRDIANLMKHEAGSEDPRRLTLVTARRRLPFLQAECFLGFSASPSIPGASSSSLEVEFV
jgi:uncharacterized membrane protein